jgi:xanthine dehydrogenase accessory factor
VAGDDASVLAELAGRIERGEAVVLATAVRNDGSPPCEPGRKLLVGTNGPIAGTLGCAEFDSAATSDAGAVLADGRPTLRHYEHPLGTVEVFLEPHGALPLLVVLGATPVAASLLRWGPELGWRTVLVERRPGRVTPVHRQLAGAVTSSAAEAVAPAVAARAGAGPSAVVPLPVDAVHTDHDAPGVVDDVAALLEAGARFVGVMGSSRHTGDHLAALRRRGVAEEAVARVRTPVGLDIGSRTAPEIALSILAGLVAARSGRQGGWLHRR